MSTLLGSALMGAVLAVTGVPVGPSWAIGFPSVEEITVGVTGPILDELIKKAEQQTEQAKNEIRKKAMEELDKQLAKLDQELKERIREIREKAKG